MPSQEGVWERVHEVKGLNQHCPGCNRLCAQHSLATTYARTCGLQRRSASRLRDDDPDWIKVASLSDFPVHACAPCCLLPHAVCCFRFACQQPLSL